MRLVSENLLSKVNELSEKDAFFAYRSLVKKGDGAGALHILNSLSRDKRMKVLEYEGLYSQKFIYLVARYVAVVNIALGFFNELIMKNAAGIPICTFDMEDYKELATSIELCKQKIADIDDKADGVLVFDEFEDFRKSEIFASYWMLLIFDKQMSISR
jgi:hypothetical protein